MRRSTYDEKGSSLILALVFVFAIGILLVVITNLAGVAASTTYGLRSERTTELTAENLVTMGMAQVRTNPTICNTAGPNLSNQAVYCSQVINSDTSATRTVDFYACPSVTPCSPASTGKVLHATVVYDDIPPNNPFGGKCSPGGATSTCGIQVSVQAWDINPADS